MNPTNFPSPGNRKGKGFMYGVLLWIFAGTLGFNLCAILPRLVPEVKIDAVIAAIGVNFLFLLTIIAYFKAWYTDPGTVPPHYGFYLGEDTKRRRYCKVCHVWKPERSHHCSTCNRCVLLMDHHCPWIDNCIGFYNRKFFIQLLVFALIWLTSITGYGIFALFRQGVMLWPRLRHNWQLDDSGMSLLQYIVLFLVLLSSFTMTIVLIPFTQLHLTLIARNSTTIESMDAANNPDQYDLGRKRNFEQVLGPNVLLWCMPCHSLASRPVGDGIRWRTPYRKNTV